MGLCTLKTESEMSLIKLPKYDEQLKRKVFDAGGKN
jgi:hypothetical protein